MNLTELGSLLTEKRQSKNLSIADVSQAIKIPQQSLASIEQGDLECIGYETYYKSFLKCYMLYLGYSFQEYQDVVNTVEGFSDEIAVQKTLKPQYGETEEQKAKPRDKKLAIQLLIVAVLGGSAYFYFSQNDSLLGGDKAETPVIEEKKSEPSNPFVKENTEKKDIAVETLTAQNAVAEEKAVQDNKEAAQNETNSASEKEQQSGVKDNAQKEKEIKEAAPELVVQNVQEQKEETPADLETFLKENPAARVIDWTKVEAAPKGEQQAVMYAKQDCWMQYNQDGKSGHFIIRKGDQRVFNFKQSLYFRIANGSAITLFHNKKPVEVGDSTKVREVNLK